MRLIRNTLTLAVVIALSAAAGATGASLITGAQIKDGSLTGKDIRNRSIKRADLAPSARAKRGPQGLQGATGQAGAPGARGEQGPAAPLHQFETVTDQTAIGQTGSYEIVAVCPTGTHAIGGGYRIGDGSGIPVDDAKTTVLRSEPDTLPNGRSAWRVLVRNDETYPLLVAYARAVCTSTPVG